LAHIDIGHCALVRRAGPGALERPRRRGTHRFHVSGRRRKKYASTAFLFLSERLGGSSPKVLVGDSSGVKWRVKGGLETQTESFITRLVAALGYYADPTAFVAHGKIEGVTSLKRAAGFIQSDGAFSNGSLQRRHGNLKALTQDWAWKRNPF
jgi:hypothetical protein